MPKTLSLKKVQKVPPKNQASITNFFKTTTSTQEINKDVKGTGTLQEIGGKRKAELLMKTEEDVISHNTRGINENCKNDYSFKKLKKNNNIGNHDNSSPEKIPTDRLPLSPVINVGSNKTKESITSSPIKRSITDATNDANVPTMPMLKSKLDSPRRIISTPKKSHNESSPLRRSPRIADLNNVNRLSPSQKEKNKAKIALDFTTEDVGDMFDDEFELEALQQEAKGQLDLSTMQRCQIIDIQQKLSTTELTVKDANDKQATCVVEGIWRDTEFSMGDTLSIIASLSADNRYTVSNSSGLLVLRPDHLMSSTSVVAGVFCRRKAVLQERFRGIDSANNAMTIGILVHELVQNALTHNISDPTSLRNEAETILKQSVHMLYDADLTIDSALAAMATYISPLAEFMQLYMSNNTSARKSYSKDKWNGHINEVLDIEENVCCPQLGVKGKIDATLQVTIHERKGAITATVPLELKSGRASGSAEHRGQLVLYGMMLSLLGGENPAHAPNQRGLLLYLKDRVDLREVSCGYPERRDLVILRNQLVQYLTAAPQQKDPDELLDIEDAAHEFRQELPEPVHHETACTRCPYLTTCSLYLWNTDGPQVSDKHPLGKLRKEALGHLSHSHIQYFLHWAALLRLEEKKQMSSAPLNVLWTESPTKRSERGLCLSNLQLKSVEASNDRFLHVFQHQLSNITETKKCGPKESEYGIVSIDSRPWIAAGTVVAIRSGELHILLERNLARRYSKSMLFHIDSYESYASTVQNLTNLAALMEENDQADKLRRLLIDKDQPEFELKLNREVGRIGVRLMKHLNKEQQRAVLKALTAKDYMLLQGLPGTGKTQTITVLIQMLVALKQRVLVTAHTHSAVDTVLSRLPSSLRILRLGSASRISASLASCSEKNVAASCKTPEDLAQLYNAMEVVGVTCLGSNHALLSKTTFDICIVDEATQVLQSTVLRPLLAAKRFVLVGDPEQLPPVVRSRHARKLGMEESLFSRLRDTDGMETLKLQYRMNATLSHLANEVAYDGRLQCATASVKDATLSLNMEKIQQKFENAQWLSEVCSTSMTDAAIFLDTGPGRNSNGARNCANKMEAYIVLAICHGLITGGAATGDIGIMAPYREQVGLLRNSIGRLCIETNIPDVSTVDQFQGKDKSVIIYSCTKTDCKEDKKIMEGEVLNDQRRLAVAVTRAKHKLIVVGDAQTMARYTPFQRLLEACSRRTMSSREQTQLVKDYSGFVVENNT